jgi:zinc protease
MTNIQIPSSRALPSPETIHRTTLDNGITVLVYENPAVQSVVVSGALVVGSQHETPARSGLAALTIDALMRGTARRDSSALAAALEDIGADMGYSPGVHRVSVSGKALAEDFETLLDVLAETLIAPAFPEHEVERLRGETLTYLQLQQDDTRFRAGEAFYATLYPPGHPYHYNGRGTPETVASLTAADLRAFHREHFGAAGMILVVVGAVKPEAALDAVRARLEGWHGAAAGDVPFPPAPTPRQTSRVFVPMTGKTQTDIVLGTIGPARAADDYLAAMLANSILGQFGMMGRIGQVVREDLGLAYYAYSQLEGGLGAAPWSIQAGVDPDDVELAIEKISDELRHITRDPVSEEDLADNKAYFTGHLPLQLESSEGVAGTLLRMEQFGLGLDYLVTYRDRLYRLTRDDVLRAARRYLDPDALVIAVAGPE